MELATSKHNLWYEFNIGSEEALLKEKRLPANNIGEDTCQTPHV